MSETDLELLASYSRRREEDAFAELVRRHLHLVYSSALRQVRSSQLAEEVAQSVFVELARQAHRLAPDTILSAWLYRVTHRIALNVIRREVRRQLREQIAFEMNVMNASAADWTHIEPLLDEAMHALDETDRTAVLLRFFENKSLREVGQALGASEDAAQKRVSRAVERLREFFAGRGIAIGASGLILGLSANAVQAAPVGLFATISTTVVVAETSIAATVTATNTVVMTTLQKSLIAATLVAAIGTGIYEVRHASGLQHQVLTLQQQQGANATQLEQLTRERDEAVQQLAVLRSDGERLGRATDELLKLRGEVTRLKSGLQETARLRTVDTNDQTLSEAVIWKNRVRELKQYLEKSPGAGIPELQFVTEQDWLDAARGKLGTDEDFRRALSALRLSGENKAGSIFSKALIAYIKDANGQFPTELAQLQPYFESPLDPAILDRWKIAGKAVVPNVGVGDIIITQKAPVDEVFDQRLVIGSGGGRGSTDFLSPETRAAMKPVFEAYRAAHNGQWQVDFSELQAYVTTPEQQAALQKLILRNSGSK
jgi:RNA polymerase sigma factor (sigma-70 family)